MPNNQAPSPSHQQQTYPHQPHPHPRQRNYGSLRRRIQSGMFYSTLLSMLMLLCLLVPLIYGLFIPISAVFTSSITGDIYTRLDTMMLEYNSAGKPYPKNAPSMKQLQNWSLDQLVDYADQMYLEKGNFDLLSLENLVPSTVTVGTPSDEVHKLVITAISSAYSDFERRFPLRSIVGEDLLMIVYRDGQSSPLLCFPNDPKENAILHFETPGAKSASLEKAFYEHSKGVLTLLDDGGNAVGTITITVNPTMIYGLVIATLIIVGVAVLLTLPLISLLIKFHARNILRPVDQLNRQMAALAVNDFYGINDFHFNVKRPPKELVMLMNSATEIMERLNDQNQELDAQKQELEAQNIELEAQNTALTESKETIQSQQDQLVRSEKMATLGQISAAIAHEINTPLGAIKSNVQMMQMVLDTLDVSACTPELQKKLIKLKDMNAISHDASNRVTDIIKSLKSFSRIDQADFQDFNPIEGIESVLVLTSNLWKNKIEVKRSFESHSHIEAYASMLNQVFMNIVVNAIHAMESGGTLQIATHSKDELLTITFRDNGVGIPPKNLERIFESGFTTKDASKGTGLGLAISKGIVDKHGGKLIAYNNADGAGATFEVILPLVQPK